jgi:DNA ligase 1
MSSEGVKSSDPREQVLRREDASSSKERSGADFLALAQCLENVRLTSSKTKKVELIAEFLARLDPSDAEASARMAAGRASQSGSRDEVQVGYSTILDILKSVCDATQTEISEIYLKHGDLGEVAQELLESKRSETTLFHEPIAISEIQGSFERMRSAKGKGSATVRQNEVKALLLRATPLEAKYIVKILSREMRTGMVQGLIEQAVGKAFSVPEEEIEHAHLVLGDVGELARRAAKHDLEGVKIKQFRPLNFMLAEPLPSPKEAADKFGGKPVYVEYKYDGVRAQVHKLDSEVRIYSRRLEDVTPFFPEIKSSAQHIGHDFILDGEIVPFRSGKPLPFQLLQRRLRRVKGMEEASGNAPILYFAFDILLLDGREMYREQLRTRSVELARLLKDGSIPMAERATASSEVDFSTIFRRSRNLGYEGLVLKDPESVYTMGRRGTGWAKLKEELDTIDAVIVAAEYGHGKRAGVISDYTFAVRSDDGTLKTIGKAYSGLTDEEIDSMTARLKKITIRDYGYRRTVKPEIVVEVSFDAIMRSDRHDSGYALRFPRIKRIRDDKSLAEIDTLERVTQIFSDQAVRLDAK